MANEMQEFQLDTEALIRAIHDQYGKQIAELNHDLAKNKVFIDLLAEEIGLRDKKIVELNEQLAEALIASTQRTDDE